MAKSAKKAPPKKASKSAKKAPKKVVKKAAKKAAKKAVRQPAKKTSKRFLLLYHSPADAMAQTANVTPEQMEAGMALWRAWAARAGKRLADLGAPLINGKSMNSKGSTAPSNKEVSGYSLLDAEDWEEVMDLIEGHPHISGWHPDATIEIHETLLLPGM